MDRDGTRGMGFRGRLWHRAGLTGLLVLLALAACREESTRRGSADKESNSAAPASRKRFRADRSAPNILLITIDTLRADHLGCYGYFRATSPHLDALAAESILFENCFCPLAETLPTHTSILTGVYPNEHGMTANLARGDAMFRPSPVLKTLAQILEKEGYSTAGIVSAETLKKVGGINQGFDYWREPEGKSANADNTFERAIAWLDTKPEPPFFFWVHFFDCHKNYEPPPPYDTMFAYDDRLEAYMNEREISESSQKKEGRHTRHSAAEFNLYDGEIRFVDEHVGMLMDELRKRNLYDDLVMVITADHGEGLGQHGLPGHDHIWLEQIHVPLFMKIPGNPPRRVTTHINSVDIFPTLCGRVKSIPGKAFLEQTTGRDVLANDEDRYIFSQRPTSCRPYFESLMIGDWRLIADLQGDAKLFNLKEDPFELKNVADAHPELVSEMLTQLSELVKEQKTLGEQNKAGEIITIDKEHKANLSALGYVEGDENEQEVKEKRRR